MVLERNKKGQGLALNTIVIAILVVIVLLVIIVMFTSNITKTNKTVDGVSGCSMDNPAVSIKYSDVKIVRDVDAANFNGNQACGYGWEYTFGAGRAEKTDENGEVISYDICCGKLK